MSVLISVIIPLFNKEPYIQDTLKSVRNQTFENFEIIIINDGSTDKSVEIAKIALSGCHNFTIYNQKNKGLSAARNQGISIANGSIIALIDADDLWENSFLESIYSLYLTFPEAKLYGTDYREKYSNSNILEPKKNIDPKLKATSFLIKDFFKSHKFQPIICQSSMAFKKEITETILFDEDIDYAEDVDFYLKSFTKYKLAYDYFPHASVLYNIPNQITNVGIKNKKLPDLDKYEKENPNNNSLKQYLDFKRYTYSIQYKLNSNKIAFASITKNLNYKNLTLRQRILLRSPLIILKILKLIKKTLLNHNIKITSFENNRN